MESFVRHLRILLTWLSLGHDFDTMMNATLHNGMILSSLNISSRDFTLGWFYWHSTFKNMSIFESKDQFIERKKKE